jgi:hypothetical protein
MVVWTAKLKSSGAGVKQATIIGSRELRSACSAGKEN